jgi:transcriptional antiterminator NusG
VSHLQESADPRSNQDSVSTSELEEGDAVPQQPEKESSQNDPADSAGSEVSQDSAETVAAEEAVAEEAVAEEADATEDETEDDETEDELDNDGPIEELDTEEEAVDSYWYIVKVQVNREDSIRAAIERRAKVAGLDDCFEEVMVPTEDIVEFTKTGKKRLVKRKLYPGYLWVHMAMTDDAWFLVRETPGVGDFTGSGPGSRPAPLEQVDVDRIVNVGADAESGEAQVKTAIPFKTGERVRVKEGNFENFEGEVETIDEANGRVTVIITIFGRSTPVELEHWQIESL